MSRVLVSSSTCDIENATESHYKTLVQMKWKSFDQFFNMGMYRNSGVLKFRKTNGTYFKFHGSCPAFFKHYMCKHIVATAIRQKMFVAVDLLISSTSG